jgi:hypothetical protein
MFGGALRGGLSPNGHHLFNMAQSQYKCVEWAKFWRKQKQNQQKRDPSLKESASCNQPTSSIHVNELPIHYSHTDRPWGAHNVYLLWILKLQIQSSKTPRSAEHNSSKFLQLSFQISRILWPTNWVSPYQWVIVEYITGAPVFRVTGAPSF